MTMDKGYVSDHPFPNCFKEELLVITRGEGVYVEDQTGKRYLDLAGGIAVNALGYGRRDLAEIAAEQMLRLAHISNLFATEPGLELAAKMTAGDDFAAVQFHSSGTEANEAALKFARLFALRTRGEGHHKLLCFTGSFHGRTLGALSVTPTAKYQDPFKPLIPGVEVAPYNDIKALATVLDGSFAAVIVEVVQGEGGLACMTPAFAAELNKLCRRHEVMLIADEVQTGMSRTGSFYASREVGLKPDMITLAKPLAGGLPLSAVLIPRRVNDLMHPGEHGTTFGGGPVACAVAGRVWDILSDPELIAEVAEKGKILRAGLEKLSAGFPFLGEVRGRGLLVGLEFTGPQGERLLEEVMQAAPGKGLLVLRSGKNMLRLAPPLVIPPQELARGLALLGEIFAELKL
jgi:acetylornithine/N-succinyldiaminopimelate aminotransferase